MAGRKLAATISCAATAGLITADRQYGAVGGGAAGRLPVSLFHLIGRANAGYISGMSCGGGRRVGNNIFLRASGGTVVITSLAVSLMIFGGASTNL